LTLPAESSIVTEGFPLEGPAVLWEKGAEAFSNSTHILGDLVGNISESVQIVHDADWEQFPEIGEAIKAQCGEDQCFAVASAPEKSTWAVGVASGWKGRDSAAKLALSLALAAQDPAVMKQIAKNYPEFGQLCRGQGLNVGPGFQAPVAPPAWGKQKKQTIEWEQPGATGEAPKVHLLTVDGNCKVVQAGLPQEVAAIEHSKQQKEFFSNAHSILGEMIEDISAEVTFEDDAECTIMPEIAQALKASAGEENCFCVARADSHGCWGVGVAAGWKGRESAAKLMLALSLAQATGRLEELAQTYPEFGQVCATAGLVAATKKRRKGQW